MGNVFEKLEEDTVYEVLISTKNKDNSAHVKPFGITLHNNNIILKLYPNRTLLNIKHNNTFSVHFTNNPLLYTKSILGVMDEKTADLSDVIIDCDVNGIIAETVEDTYGKNVLTIINAKAVNIHENNKYIPTINRATNNIIELLVLLSRYEYLDYNNREKFHKKVEETERLIEKTGNKKHKESIKLIKKEIRKN